MSRLYKAPRPIEKASQIPVCDYPRMVQSNIRLRVADVFILGARAGDELDVRFKLQVTNDLPYPVETGIHLVWTPWPTGIAGIAITPEAGLNVTQQVPGQGGMHHYALTDDDIFEVPKYCDGDGYVAAILVTGGGSNSAWGDYLKIDVGAGKLTVKHTPKSMP